MVFKIYMLLLEVLCTYVLANELVVCVPQTLSQCTVTPTGRRALNAGNLLSTTNAARSADKKYRVL